MNVRLRRVLMSCGMAFIGILFGFFLATWIFIRSGSLEESKVKYRETRGRYAYEGGQ